MVEGAWDGNEIAERDEQSGSLVYVDDDDDAGIF